MHGNELCLFLAKAFLPTLSIDAATYVEAVGTIFDVFRYDAVLSRDSNLSTLESDDKRMCYMLSHGHGTRI